jgi:hypothetical protein
MYVFILVGVVATPIILTGIVGNSLTVAVMAKEQKASTTSRMLMCLAIADGLTLVSAALDIPVLGFKTVANAPPSVLEYNDRMVVPVYILIWIFNQMSTFFVLLITWQRYLSVCVPHKVKLFARRPGLIF